MQQVVVCAAMRSKDGKNVILAGARHFDSVMRSQIKAMDRRDQGEWDQGFIDQFGKFLDRKEAWEIADKMGQIRRPTGYEQAFNTRQAGQGDKGILFSENLY